MFFHLSKYLRSYQYLFLILIAASYTSCKKDSDEDVPPNASPKTGTRNELTLDSIFLYAKEIYYWQEALPDYATFNPRKRYAGIFPERTAYQKELFDITQYKLNAAGLPYEKSTSGEYPRYSYLAEEQMTSAQHAATLVSIMPSSEGIQKVEMSKDKIGYLSFHSFDPLSNMKAELDKAFEEFAFTGIEALIIDLRHNQGGYVETAEYIANLIAPSSLQSKVMFSELFNPILRSGRASILRHQPYLDDNGNQVRKDGKLITLADINFSENANITKFTKAGKLETVKKIYFLVTGKTASASELLISCFKPHLPVRLVGERTYGKPVGFFPVNIDQYEIYLASFLLRNADGWSDYFDGIPADILVKENAVDLSGDNQDIYISAVLKDIEGSTGKKSSLSSKKMATVHRQQSELSIQQSSDFIPIVKRQFKLK